MAAKKTPKSKKNTAKPTGGGGKVAPKARLSAKAAKAPPSGAKDAKKPRAGTRSPAEPRPGTRSPAEPRPGTRSPAEPRPGTRSPAEPPRAGKPDAGAKAAPPAKAAVAKAPPAKAAAPAKAPPAAKASPPPPHKPAPEAPAKGAKTAKVAKLTAPPRSEKRQAEPKAPREKAPPSLREPPRVVPLPIPVLAPIVRPSIEERAADIDKRLEAQSEDFKRRYIDNFDMSWIYHDSALEGVVYTFDELRGGLSGQAPPVTDSSLQPTSDDIRRHKEAIDFVRDFATKKRLPVTLDVIKKIYLILRPEEGDIKTVKYRKDVPQHRLYFHEYAPPDKIAYKVRGVIDWLNSPETRKTRNGIRIAARAHYDLLRAYPFPNDSGKVARLFMNLLLLRAGLPPSIIHSTERQRYYEALKGSANIVLQMVQESVENALSSVEKLLDEHETRTRAFVS
jgi:hypothetical protein